MEEKVYTIIGSWRSATNEEGDTGVYALCRKFYRTKQQALDALHKFVEEENAYAKQQDQKEVWETLDDQEYRKYEYGDKCLGVLDCLKVEELKCDRLPFWSREHDLLDERRRLWGISEDAKTLGELVRRTGVNAVRVFDKDSTYLGYAYLEENGEVYIEDSGDSDRSLVEDTPITNANLDRDDDDYTIIICDLQEEK